jgi:hypothetical protein
MTNLVMLSAQSLLDPFGDVEVERTTRTSSSQAMG